jgi:beta-lactamase class D
MKKVLGILLTTVLVSSAYAQAEMKKVCHNEEKNGKTVEVCKTIKVHKKLEGTDVPVKK